MMDWQVMSKKYFLIKIQHERQHYTQHRTLQFDTPHSDSVVYILQRLSYIVIKWNPNILN